MRYVSYIQIALGALLILMAISFVVLRKDKKRVKPDMFQERWQELQRLCANKSTWALAVVNADKLLDEALKKCKFKGKSTGERLVEAQKKLSDNDGVWFAHNLAKKILLEDMQIRLKEGDVKKSLVGFRQALRDLGALRVGKS